MSPAPRVAAQEQFPLDMANQTSVDTKMTTAQLGRRMDRVEEDVGLLKTEVAKTTSSVEGLRGDMSILFTKMDQVIAGTSGVAATKDMIPSKYITWGIGLSISTLFAMISVGLTVTGVAGGVVLWAMNSGDNKIDARIDAVVALEESRHELVKETFAHVRDDVTENRIMHQDVESRLRVREQNAFTTADAEKLGNRISVLEVQAVENNALATKAWDEIVDHDDELDHPIRQLFEGEGRDILLKQLQEQVRQLQSKP